MMAVLVVLFVWVVIEDEVRWDEAGHGLLVG